MKVLIVAKTRQGGGACIGAIAEDGRSMRLIAFDAAENEHHGLEYQVGDVWDVEVAKPPEPVQPPHTENVVVRWQRRLRQNWDLLPAIEKYMPPQRGGIQVLYDGLTQHTPGGALYIAAPTGIPGTSTLFWRPDQPLQRVDDGVRVRYRYPTSDGGRTLTFVGFQEPVVEIPAHTVLRVSLAHWWRPADQPDHELRCYVQLSGWYGLDAAVPEGPQLLVPPVDLYERLRTVFGYGEFRPLQEEIIQQVLAGRPTLAVMPTGAGKSLCYQLPALALAGLTVVVSPLIALMQDQVDQLRELGVAAAFLNSSLDYGAYRNVMERVRQGALKLLYVAPETLLRPEILLLLDQANVCCLAVDEAHCISEWGHDFRPEYRQLTQVRSRYSQAACLALTATATPRVQDDIRSHLRIEVARTFIASFDRPNLFLEVSPRVDGPAQALAFVRTHPQQSGIIYCSTKQQVDDLCAMLVRQGVAAAPYHAGLDARTRAGNQRRFIRDDVQVMVATIAFGMGIDKPDVRFVLHYNVPQDLETYYQQIGRAGRDGLRADCLLLFSYADVYTIRRFIEEGAEDQARGRHLRLEAMLRWATSTTCRRQQLLSYFGEDGQPPTCALCDNCQTPADARAPDDLTVPARQFLTAVLQTREQFGINHVIQVLRGSQAQPVLRWHHERLPCYGSGVALSAENWKHLAPQFMQQGLLVQDMDHGQLLLTDAGRAVLAGEATVRGALQAPRAAAPVAPALEESYEPALFEQLRQLRKELADAAGVPPYVIFHDRTLREIATRLPQSEASLAQLHGLGQRKLEQYGSAVLALVTSYCQEHGLAEQPGSSGPPQASSPNPPGKVTARTAHAAQLLDELGSIQAVAQALEIKPATVVNHLYNYISAGQPLPIAPLRASSSLAASRQAEVMAAFEELGTYLGPLFEAFAGQVPYEELHILRLVFLAERTPQ